MRGVAFHQAVSGAKCRVTSEEPMAHSTSPPPSVGIVGSEGHIVVMITVDGKQTDTEFATLAEASGFAAEERARLKSMRDLK